MRTILSCAALIGGTAIIYKYYTRLRPVSEDQVIWSWLKSEMLDENSILTTCYLEASLKYGDPSLVNPNFDNHEENMKRKAIFLECRDSYLGPVEHVREVNDLKDRNFAWKINHLGEFLSWSDIDRDTRWYQRKMLSLPGDHARMITWSIKNVKNTLKTSENPVEGHLPIFADVYVGIRKPDI